MCKQEYNISKVTNDISGCKYDANEKTCHIYNKAEQKVIRGGYKNNSNSKKGQIKASYCVTDSDCDDNNTCIINTCNVMTSKYRNKLQFRKCRTFGEPTSLAIRVKVVDAETTISMNEIKTSLFSSSKKVFLA